MWIVQLALKHRYTFVVMSLLIVVLGATSVSQMRINTVKIQVDGPHVAIVDKQNKIVIKPVRLERDLGNRVVAISGIQGGERLIVNPGDDLTNGIEVQVDRRSEEGGEIAQR